MSGFQLSVLEDFKCVGSDCEDSCCSQWLMQVDDVRVSMYQAAGSELADSISVSDGVAVMKRDPETKNCVKLCGGLCSLQTSRGTDYLGDACHFYPRIPRDVGNETCVSATLSCPEMSRLALFSKRPLALVPMQLQRRPQSISSYASDFESSAPARALLQRLLDMVESHMHEPEVAMARLVQLAALWRGAPEGQWLAILERSDGNLQCVRPDPKPSTEDAVTLMQVMAGQVVSSKGQRPQVLQLFKVIANSLNIHMDWETLHIYGQSQNSQTFAQLSHQWTDKGRALHRVLGRWLQAQIIAGFFPFAGLGASVEERALILAMKFAFMRLTLMAHLQQQGTLSESKVASLVQLASRSFDHLSDAQLPVNLARQMGWNAGHRLRALIGDFDAFGYLASLRLASRRGVMDLPLAQGGVAAFEEPLP